MSACAIERSKFKAKSQFPVCLFNIVKTKDKRAGKRTQRFPKSPLNLLGSLSTLSSSSSSSSGGSSPNADEKNEVSTASHSEKRESTFLFLFRSLSLSGFALFWWTRIKLTNWMRGVRRWRSGRKFPKNSVEIVSVWVFLSLYFTLSSDVVSSNAF